MKLVNHQLKLTFAALLVAFGINKLLAQLFLGNWEVLSAGESDIAARGIWLLALFLPAFALGSVILGIVLLITLTRRTGEPLKTRVAVATIGSVAGAGLVFFGADPTVPLLNAVSWSSDYTYYVASAIAALLAFGGGILLVLRVSRALRLQPAAA